MYYFTGFLEEPMERLLVTVVPAEGTPEFIVPGLYGDQVRAASWVPEIRTWGEAENPVELLRRRLGACVPEKGRVAVDGRSWAQFLLPLFRPPMKWRLELADPLIVPLRVRKSSEELRALQVAFRITDRVMNEAIAHCKRGITEAEIQTVIMERIRRERVQGLSFPPIVACGPNAAMPHYRGGDVKFRHGQAVVLDFGCRSEGYCSDITRTVFVEACSPELRRVYRLVDEANQRGFEAAQAGTPAEAVDRAARSFLSRAGLGQFFIHRTGHGIGLEIHEEPYLVKGNGAPLEPGMVFSVEPGVYVPGRFGVRIEDIVHLGSRAGERLTRTSHELRIV
jgi:Xaa-Pro dipeptidase